MYRKLGDNAMKMVALTSMIVLACAVGMNAGEKPAEPAAAKPAEQAGDTAPAEPKPVLVVFDLESQGDEGDLGKWMAANIRAKLFRKGIYVLIEEMDVNLAVQDKEFAPKLGTPVKDVADFARDQFGADFALWGETKMIGDKVSFSVKLASTTDEPEMIIDDTFTAENRHVAAIAVEEMIRRITSEEAPKEHYDPAWDVAWAEGPNLVKNPGFEEADGDHPAFWDPWGKDYHHNMVQWVDAPGPGGNGKCIKFEMNADIAGSYGVGYYGEPIDISDGKRYRFSVRVKSMGPAVKIFLKHYCYFSARGNETEGQWRETRRAPMNCRGSNKEWKEFVRDFSPHRSDAHDPSRTRVELYAYWPEGIVYFDDAVMKKLE